MGDYTELKRLAEAAKEACGDYIPLNDGGMSVHQLIGRIEACENTEPLCDAERTVLLAISRAERDQLKAENDRLESEAVYSAAGFDAAREEISKLRAEVAGLKTGYEAYEQVNAELRAEVEALRKWLLEAAEEIDTWGSYASDYFQEKHGLRGCVDKFHAAALGQGERS